ncbi:hypothetical protein APY04_1615 [Hyphomicrobium sulfonivorans]|uniref:Uncharacterized protein n=1 Tax=Hyphomicrobium sulfonivorans TaxID=121290 RepID=A0A109BHY9_HYPSL|nr:hypothetical protein APY04_1615 [Hyphomicrobium sulfonivorans]
MGTGFPIRSTKDNKRLKGAGIVRSRKQPAPLLQITFA